MALVQLGEGIVPPFFNLDHNLGYSFFLNKVLYDTVWDWGWFQTSRGGSVWEPAN